MWCSARIELSLVDILPALKREAFASDFQNPFFAPCRMVSHAGKTCSRNRWGRIYRFESR